MLAKSIELTTDVTPTLPSVKFNLKYLEPDWAAIQVAQEKSKEKASCSDGGHIELTRMIFEEEHMEKRAPKTAEDKELDKRQRKMALEVKHLMS